MLLVFDVELLVEFLRCLGCFGFADLEDELVVIGEVKIDVVFTVS